MRRSYKNIESFILLALLCISTATAATLSDTEKEQRWADQVIETLFDGEAIWLTMNQTGVDLHKFLAIEMEADNDDGLAMIVVHGIGIHPNWEQIVRPIRVEMNNRGWHTLSIQMPILTNDKLPEDYAPLFAEVPSRFEAAINYLKDKGAKKIVIVAHSLGAAMTTFYLANTVDSEIAALVGIGMPNVLDNLQTIKIPVLDLYGSEDLLHVIENVKDRLLSTNNAENMAFQQIEVMGANHFFDGKEDQLIEQIDRWINALAVISPD